MALPLPPLPGGKIPPANIIVEKHKHRNSVSANNMPECPGPTWPSAQWAGWSLVPKAPSSKLGPDPHLFRLSSPQEQGWRCVGDM